jgi:hypothetical protein
MIKIKLHFIKSYLLTFSVSLVPSLFILSLVIWLKLFGISAAKLFILVLYSFNNIEIKEQNKCHIIYLIAELFQIINILFRKGTIRF